MTPEDDGGEVAVTAEELERIISEQKCSVGVMTTLRKLSSGFPNPRAFLEASDSDLRRRGRCGARIFELVAKIRERCYFLMRNREERFRYNRAFEKFLEDRDRRQAIELERLNPVFTANDLQAAALYMGEEKVEYIDLRRLNEFRYAMTAAQRAEMKRRHDEAAAERARAEAEEAARRERERAERAERAKARRERQEKAAKAPDR